MGPGNKLGAVTQMRYRPPIFILNFIQNFFRVGLCPTLFLPFASDVDARRALDSIMTAEIEWTRVQAIVNQARALMLI